ncbi:hypothetical protein [Rhizobium sp. A37_96]
MKWPIHVGSAVQTVRPGDARKPITAPPGLLADLFEAQPEPETRV